MFHKINKKLFIPHFIEKKLNKNFIEIKIWQRNLYILNEYVGKNFLVHNGKEFISLTINPNMVGYRFGEFVFSRKKYVFKKNK